MVRVSERWNRMGFQFPEAAAQCQLGVAGGADLAKHEQTLFEPEVAQPCRVIRSDRARKVKSGNRTSKRGVERFCGE